MTTITAVWVVCRKCDSKFDSLFLQRKQILHCPLCQEPGLVVLDGRGNPTEETWPDPE